MTATCWVLVAVSFALLVAVHVLFRRCGQRLAEAKAIREDADWLLSCALDLGDRTEARLNEAREHAAQAKASLDEGAALVAGGVRVAQKGGAK